MIKIEVKAPQFLKKEAEALFISFPYNIDTVAKVKSLPTRYYVNHLKAWEVPVGSLAQVLETFSDREINLICDNKDREVKEAKKPALKVVEQVTKMVEVANFNFKTKPFDHQIEAFNYAMKKAKFLLGDEQGLGKTKQAIDIANARMDAEGFKHTLIICGVNSVKHNWLKEVAIHSDAKAHILGSKIVKGKIKEGSTADRLADLKALPDARFIITNIETLRSKEIAEKLQELTTEGVIGMVIIDEIHKAKNAQSQQGKAIHSLKAKYKLALTGTPIMNSPLDAYNVLKWLDAERHSFYQFRARYCVMGGYGGHEVVGYKNMDELQALIDKNMLRRKKGEVLNLPPKIRHTEYVEMTAKQAQLYKEVKLAIQANIEEIALSPNPLAQLIRLRQVTGSPSILSKTITESAKIERMKELIEEEVENGRKVIVFTNWQDMIDAITPELKQYNPAIITGTTKDRQAEVDRFQNDSKCKVAAGTIGAMGTGLTMTAATTVIFLDKPWNMANTEQAEDRAHRIGTTGTVNVITLVCKDTIDERIEEILAEKGDIADALVDGNMNKLNRMNMLAQLLS